MQLCYTRVADYWLMAAPSCASSCHWGGGGGRQEAPPSSIIMVSFKHRWFSLPLFSHNMSYVYQNCSAPTGSNNVIWIGTCRRWIISLIFSFWNFRSCALPRGFDGAGDGWNEDVFFEFYLRPECYWGHPAVFRGQLRRSEKGTLGIIPTACVAVMFTWYNAGNVCMQEFDAGTCYGTS